MPLRGEAEPSPQRNKLHFAMPPDDVPGLPTSCARDQERVQESTHLTHVSSFESEVAGPQMSSSGRSRSPHTQARPRGTARGSRGHAGWSPTHESPHHSQESTKGRFPGRRAVCEPLTFWASVLTCVQSLGLPDVNGVSSIPICRSTTHSGYTSLLWTVSGAPCGLCLLPALFPSSRKSERFQI